MKSKKNGTSVLHLWSKLIFCLLILLGTIPTLQAQYWERQYDDEILGNVDFGKALVDHVHNTNDGGFIIVGRLSIPLDNREAYLMKIHENGTVNWLDYYSPLTNNATLLPMGSALTLDNGVICSFIKIPNNTPWEKTSEIAKYDASGNAEWVQQYDYKLAGDIVVSNTGDYFMSGYYDYIPYLVSGYDELQLTKLDAAGAMVWTKTYPLDTESEHNSKLVTLSNGQLIISGFSDDESSLILLKTDADGNSIWKLNYENTGIALAEEMILTSNEDIILIGDMTIARIDQAGNLLWTQTLSGNATDVKELENGNLVVVTEIDPDPSSLQDFNYVQINKLTATGELVSTHSLQRARYLTTPHINLYPNQDFLISTSSAISYFDSIPYLFRTDSLGVVFYNKIQGQVAHDENDNCIVDSDEFPLHRWLVSATSPAQTFYDITDENGDYCMEVDTGNYIVEIHPPFDYWEACQDSVLQEITLKDTVTIDFAMEGIYDCPLMTIDVSSWANVIRRCWYSPYFVNYCNYGTIHAEDAYLEITFDDAIQVDSASIMWSSVNGQTYTFDLGTVEINECNDFVIHTTVDPTCDSTMLEETLCVEAHIYPDTLCFPTPDWDGSSITVNASCIEDSIHFYIQNVGTAPTSEMLDYIVIEDNIMKDQGAFTLAPQAIKELVFEASGTTMRLEAEQANDHPGFSMPSTTIEGCDPDGDGQFSTGFFNQWPMDDADPFIAIECLTIVGPFDPNDKTASPEGVGEDHIIRANTDLEYHIRFENIGTDTAFNVVVLDTLSPFLDITSIQLGASSFPFNFQILPGRILEFTFNQINLLPKEQNELAAQGFVKFRVRQKADNQDGTLIYNSAAIFFDNVDPIITNMTYHQIGSAIITSLPPSPKVSNAVSVYPNPFDQYTQLFIHDPALLTKTTILQLFNASGQIVSRQKITNQIHRINRNRLPAGLYFYTIEQDRRFITSGKMVLQ